MRRMILWLSDRFYRELAWTYDSATWIASGGLWYTWVLVAEHYLQEEPVLEVGFGRGRLLARLAGRGCHVVGLDRSPQMLQAAQRRLHTKGLAVPLVHGSGQALPFPDATFGTLITTFPTTYVYATATQREFTRVLRPGGAWVWVDAPYARRLTLRMMLVTLVGCLGRFNSSVARAASRGTLDAVLTAVGVVKREPQWRPRMLHSPLLNVAVEQVRVGATAVHVVVVTKLISRRER